MEHDKLGLTVKLDRERRSREKIISEGKKLAKYYKEEAANMLGALRWVVLRCISER